MILIGDCVEKCKELPDGSVHCIITTNPYGDAWSYSRYPEIMKESKDGCTGTWDFPALAREMYRVLVPGGVLCWHVGDNLPPVYETLVHARQALYFVDEIGFTLHKTIIFWRNVGDYQYVLCLSKGIPRVYNHINPEDVWRGNNRLTEDAFQFFEDGIKPNMNAAKTARWLVRDLVLTYTNEGDTVLDPFAGSCTTLQEAEKLNRKGIGIEINPKFWGY